MKRNESGLPYYQIDERALDAFLVYAARERSLDDSVRESDGMLHAAEHRRAIASLRELNKAMLFQDTRRPLRRR